MTKPMQKRSRGVVLTATGLKLFKQGRLAAEQSKNFGERYTYEKIGELTNLDINTIKKILHGRNGVDKRSLEKLFWGFGLELEDKFYTKPNSNQRQDWGEAVALDRFFGRIEECKTLSTWLLQERCRLITLMGMGGIGKTSLSIRLARQTATEFDCVIWKSLRDAPPVAETIAYLIAFLCKGKEAKVNLPARLGDKISCLIDYLRTERCLIVLDNAESLMDRHERAGKYIQDYEGYGELFQRIGATEHSSCLLLTTREKPKEIAIMEGDCLRVRSLQLSGLRREGTEIIEAKGLTGTEQELISLSDRYDGNPLALKVVSTSIQDLFAGNISKFLDQSQAVFGDLRDLLDEQFERLSAIEREIMYWLAISREPIAYSQLQSDLILQVTSIQLLEALESLSRRSLIEKSGVCFTQQSVVMEYLTIRLIDNICHEIIECRPQLLCNYPIVKATAKDYVRENQIRLILQPIVDELLIVLKGKQEIESRLQQVLSLFQQRAPTNQCYGTGNIINLLYQMEVDLTGYDFSHLCIWQADLRQARLHRVDFQNSDLAKSIFAEDFGGIWSVVFSPQDSLHGSGCIAIGDTKGDVFLRKADDNQLIGKLEGHQGWVVSLAFNPKGTLLASSSSDCTVKLWNTNTGRCLYTLSDHSQEVWSVEFSADGRTLATGCDDALVRLWDVETGQCQQIMCGHESEVLSLAFSLDGQKLLSASQDGTIRLWNLQTGSTERVYRGHEDGIRSIAVSPDGKTFASGSGDRTIRIWNIETGECLRSLKGHANVIMSVRFSPQSHLLASASLGHKVRIWNIETGECLRSLKGHSNVVSSISFDSSNSILASGSSDRTVKLWDLNSYKCLKTWQGYSNQTLSLAFSADNRKIVGGGCDCKVRIWDLKANRFIQTLDDHTNGVFCVALNRDNLLASGSGDKTVKLWDLNRGRVLKTLEGHKAGVRSLSFNWNNRVLASGSEDLTVRLWDVETGNCRSTLLGHNAEVWSVCFNPINNLLASASFDSTIKLWNVETGKCLKTLKNHKSWVWSIAFRPDGKSLISTSADRTIKIWNLETGEGVDILPKNIGHSQLIAFSVDGYSIATCSQEHDILLWRLNTGQRYRVLRGHTALINAIAFSPDGKTLVSSSEDETIRFWDLDSGECTKFLIVDKPYSQMNIADVKGLTPVGIANLKALGAVVK